MIILHKKKIILIITAILLAGSLFVYYFSRDVGNQNDAVRTEETFIYKESGENIPKENSVNVNTEENIASGTYENIKETEDSSKKNDKENTEPKEPEIKSVMLDVPFTSQAPFGNWSDARKQDGCEEAAAIMAMTWVRGEQLTAKSADEKINKIAAYEEEAIGTFHDTSAFDTIETIFKGYFEYDNVEVRYRIGKDDIIKELAKGNLVIVPTRGQLLGNPNYTPPGPVTHNLVVIGYDVKTKEFITNDPGTRKGKGYRYDEDVLIDAVFDYPTGFHEKITEEKTAMIIISK